MTNIDADEFLRGQRDCQNGVKHLAGQSDSYDRGYAAQYQHEQNMSALSRKGCLYGRRAPKPTGEKRS